MTDLPVKGVLTGSVTMLAWSFVCDDQPIGDTADNVALILRDEIADLVAAGTQTVWADESAIRELLPLNEAGQSTYLKWAVDSFRLATSDVVGDIQIHTRICYSDFNELIDTTDDLNADVTSIEAARNGMHVLAALKGNGYLRGIGPGVRGTHSSRMLTEGGISQLAEDVLKSVGPSLLWINPDCGLRT